MTKKCHIAKANISFLFKLRNPRAFGLTVGGKLELYPHNIHYIVGFKLFYQGDENTDNSVSYDL